MYHVPYTQPFLSRRIGVKNCLPLVSAFRAKPLTLTLRRPRIPYMNYDNDDQRFFLIRAQDHRDWCPPREVTGSGINPEALLNSGAISAPGDYVLAWVFTEPGGNINGAIAFSVERIDTPSLKIVYG